MTFSIQKLVFSALAATAIAAGAFVAACGGSPGASNGSNGDNGGSDGSSHTGPQCAAGAAQISTTPGSCANPTIPIAFQPMYSAYIPGDTLRIFALPAVTSDGCPATWSVSDPSQAILHVGSFAIDGVATPGVMITTKGTGGSKGPESSGQVTVFATETGGACGSSVLTITENTENDWTIGSTRYDLGVSLHLATGAEPDSGYPASDGGSFVGSDAGTPCRNCHSQQVKTGQYTDVAHTPEQAGGFSDSEMAGIILNGVVPDGGYFDPSVINPDCTSAGTTLSPSMSACGLAAYSAFQGFHQWKDIGADQVAGMICYLRSLTPEGQTGTSNFGGGH
jgi:hypothetical protein